MEFYCASKRSLIIIISKLCQRFSFTNKQAVMKQFFQAIFFLIFVSASSFGQKSTVTYIHFEEEDVDKLFYVYENPRDDNEEGITVFSYARGKQKIFFAVDNTYDRPRTAPVGMNTAENAKIGETLVSGINNQSKEVKLVFKRSASSFHVFTVKSASMMSFEGLKCVFRNQHTAFAFDTTDLNFEDNLALKKTENTVNYDVTARKGCLRQYKFTCKSQKNRQFVSELEIIPSVGVVYERTGIGKTQADENEATLSEIGNTGFADYVADKCNQTEVLPDDPAPFFDPSNPPAVREYRYGDITVRISCPELLGYGKHVVQRGDNLYSISRTYGVPVKTLVKWNDIENENVIEVCQEIWYIPPPGEAPVGPVREPEEIKVPGKVIDQRKLYPSDSDGQSWGGGSGRTTGSGGNKTKLPAGGNDSKTQTHIVKSGETLQRLATKYNCPETCIREMNKFPVKGTVGLKVGQKVIIGNCDCQKEDETYGDKQPQRSTGKGAGTERTSSGGSSTPVLIHKAVKDKKLSTIATELGYSAQELARLNNMKESDIVRAGTELKVPRRKK
jgi:LysM repeat protein